MSILYFWVPIIQTMKGSILGPPLQQPHDKKRNASRVNCFLGAKATSNSSKMRNNLGGQGDLVSILVKPTSHRIFQFYPLLSYGPTYYIP